MAWRSAGSAATTRSIVISGKDRGKTGKVLRVDPAKQRVYVEGLNIVKRHQQPDAPGAARRRSSAA